MLYSGGSAGNAGIGYAWSWDRVHWRKAEINPVFKNGNGPFLERCYTPSLVRDADGSLHIRPTADVSPDSIVVHRPASDDPTGAYQLAQLTDGQSLTRAPIGIFRNVDRPAFDDRARAQVTMPEDRTAALQSLITGKDTWTVA